MQIPTNLCLLIDRRLAFNQSVRCFSYAPPSSACVRQIKQIKLMNYLLLQSARSFHQQGEIAMARLVVVSLHLFIVLTQYEAATAAELQVEW